ncbi:hypothetical protein ABW19_dt0201590 [Dactylella cylindrospora]|nr:hypothetical protein ABW19_dt0201590 [Dactylella cylindrospora]
MLKEEANKQHIVNASAMEQCLSLVTRVQYWDDLISSGNLEDLDDEEEGEEALKLLQRDRNLVVVAIADMSAYESFPKIYPIDSGFMKSIFRWLNSPDLNMQMCAALVVGNFARDTETCRDLVVNCEVHLALVNIIKERTQVGVLHAAGGALKNLAIGWRESRGLILETGILEFCGKFYLVKVIGDLQMMGLSLVRVLVADSGRNIKRLIDPSQFNSGIPHIANILDLYNQDNELLLRIEIGRIVTSVLREISRDPEDRTINDNLLPILSGFYPRLLPPVIDMVTQDRWAVVASEGWFALALLTRYSQGATALGAYLLPKEFYQSLIKVMRGPADANVVDESSDHPYLEGKSASQAGDDVPVDWCQKDKNNAMVFLSGFLKNAVSGTELCILNHSD